jgi:hypothetical protein
MRLPRVRYSVRRMMIVVAVIGLALAMPPWLKGRGERLRLRAIHHTEEGEGGWVDQRVTKEQIEALKRRLAYHQQMAEKYRWAARYPWLPVWPDPAEPE